MSSQDIAIRSTTSAMTERQNARAGENMNDVHQYLTFRLHGDLYAFGILNVKEILEYGRLTRVPMMPDFIQGVINLRGEVVPVVNLARRFDMDNPTITKRTCIVIIEIKNDDKPQDLGVMVDSVSEVLDIQPQDIRPAPSFGARIRTDFIQGMGKLGEDFIIILAEGKVLSIEELALLEDTRRAITAADHGTPSR